PHATPHPARLSPHARRTPHASRLTPSRWLAFRFPISHDYLMRLLLLAALAPSLAAAQAPAAWPSFTRTFAAYVASDKVVGAGTVFIKNGRIVARFDTGFADRSANVRVDDQSIYHWGSITKTLTAISIMQLRDRGKLSLDDKIVRYVPELRTMHDAYGMM